MRIEQLAVRQALALAAPVLLIGSMTWAFLALKRLFGYPVGYLLAFVVYWVGWCTLLAAVLLGGPAKLAEVFRPAAPLAALNWKTQVLLWLPISFPLFFVFIPGLRRANTRIIAVSVLLGVVIGVTEEVFWRGVYLRMFPGNAWLSLVYPSAMFALWHLAPLSVRPNRLPGGALAFVAYALLLGGSYALAASRTGSIASTTVSHVIHDSLGLGALPYAQWLEPKTVRVTPAGSRSPA